MHDLGTLGGSSSYAYAINASGAIVGESLVKGDATFHAFIYQNGRMSDLGTIAGYRNAVATDINANGDVVGYAYNTDTGTYHAFLYHKGKMVDLNTLIPSTSPWRLNSASAINDNGQITGSANDKAGDRRAFVLSITG